jgi:NAD(P)-dependent dehydrogenase (short-subunit alcohol dehydrogenase family)
MLLKDKTVVISGVGLGLGKETAAAALRDGANVVMGARTEGKLRDFAAELDPSGRRITCCRANITHPEQCAALMQTAVGRFGGLDAVVQVAAFELISSTLEGTSTDEWRRSFETNVIGSVRRRCTSRSCRSGPTAPRRGRCCRRCTTWLESWAPTRSA